MKQTQIEQISCYALKALLQEVGLFPKPGLVDPISNGAHHDMNFETFIDSSVALKPFLTYYLELGFAHQGTPKELFKKVRSKGIEAEAAMLSATSGVNTHKGANFSFAVILGSVGYYLRNCHEPCLPFRPVDTSVVLSYVAIMTEELLLEDYEDLSKKNKLSAGERLYLEHGILGIRGEAAAGYPSLQRIALPFLRQFPAEKKTYLLLMLKLMSQIEDSNLINRGGIKGWQWVKQEAAQLSEKSARLSSKQLEKQLQLFDQQLIEHHLSPGGSADLLVLSMFFAYLEGQR